MRYEEIKTDGYLSNFVKCFWTSETTIQCAKHTILPDGYFDLIVEIKKSKIVVIKLTGIWTIPTVINTKPNTKIFAVRFKPLATQLLRNINLKALLNSSLILPNNFFELEFSQLNSFKTFCQQMTSCLESKIELTKPICSKRISLFNHIFQKTTFNVGELSAKSYLTSRQINRFFNSDYGLSLKTYLDIIRCNSALRNIVKNELSPTIEYYDQAHFIKETKKYTGVTPKELKRNKNDRFLQLLTIKGF